MMTNKRSAEKTVGDIRRATRRHYSAEEKIRIVLEGLRGEDKWRIRIVHFLSVARRETVRPINLVDSMDCKVDRG